MNRNKLKPAKSFVITLQKDISTEISSLRELNVKNIIDIDEFINRVHENVTIELNEKSDLNLLKDFLKESGRTKIKIKLKTHLKATYLS